MAALTREEMRAALVERHGEELQSRLEISRVAIAGLGGLGSNVAVSLARIGVGRLDLIDFDVVDVSNLNRQQYFVRQLGLPKPAALAETLREINPFVELNPVQARVTPENIVALLGGADIVCEAFDVPEQKAMLVNGVLEQLPGKPLVSASGMAGFGRSNEIVTREVVPGFWLCGDGVTGAAPGCGLMAPRVAICANHEANAIVSIIAGSE